MSKRNGLCLPLCLLLTAGLTALLAGGCSTKELALRLPFQDGELSVFEISRDGQLLLVEEMTVQRESDQYILTVESLSKTAPVIQMVFMDAATLIPQRLVIEVAVEGDTRTLLAEYGEKEVAIRTDSVAGFEETTVRLPAPPYFENEQFLMLVRALPLEEGWKGSVNLIVSKTASRAALGLEVVDRETVTVEAGNFDTYVVELKRFNQWAWVAVEEPYPVVKYENKGAGTLMELVEYFPQGR